ncbi:MAG: hypothetical protein ABIU58_03695 [Ramlibacter sp.]
MFLFDSLFPSRPAASLSVSQGETLPPRMNLEERMTFRRDLLFDIIAHTLEHNGIPAECYRLRVSRTDKRGHCFAVMVDLSNEFQNSAFSTPHVLGEIGRGIADNAKASGFLEVVGVYWRVCDQSGLGLSVAAPAHRASVDSRIYASDLAPLSPT